MRQARLLSEYIRRKWALLPPEERQAKEREAERRMQVMRQIQDSIARLPVLDARPIGEIMRDIYDEDGIPK